MIRTHGSAAFTSSGVGYTVTFSEAVTGVGINDFSFTSTNGSPNPFVTGLITTNNIVFTINLNTGSNAGKFRLDLKNSGTGIADAAGNAITQGFTGGEEYTVQIPDPAITAGGSALTAMTTNYGAASASQGFTVSGSNLTANLIITAPNGFEVSKDNGVTYGVSTSITPVSGTVASTSILVRLAATTSVGSYSGNIVLASTGATSVNLATASSTVSQRALTITANNANKTYGVLLVGGSGSVAFTPTGLRNGETIGSVTLAYGTGAGTNAGVGTYTGSVAPSAAIGGTFTASNYSISYAAGNIIVGTATLSIAANNVNKTYGQVLAGSSSSTAFTPSGLQNGETVGSVSIAYGTGAAGNAAVGTYTGSVTPSALTGGTFNASNYSISYATGNIIIGAKALTITSNNTNKTYGMLLVGGTGSAAFTASGLENGETIGSVTLAY
ncbi:MAG: hypothetical protein EOP51_31280, partial [Sphingobacteriales bacterium]